MQEQLFSQYQRIGVSFITAATTLTPVQQIVRATANTATDSYSITLAPAASCKGQFLSIIATIANSKAITLQDQDESQDWTDLTLDTDTDGALLFCDGIRWWVIANDIA